MSLPIHHESPEEVSAHWKWRFLWLIVGGVQLLALNFWPAFPSPNEWPRVFQSLAVIHRGALDIGPEVDRFGISEDVASYEGRLYPNKAPGMLPLLIPGAWLAHLLAPCGSIEELRLAHWLGRLVGSSLPFFLTWWLLSHWPGLQRKGAFLMGVAWAVASPALAAGLMLFSHALSGLLLLAGFRALISKRSGWAAFSGVLLGWACLCEYPLAIACVAGVLAMMPSLGWRHLGLITLGGFAAIVLLGAYNQHCFGAWWSLSTAHEAHGAFAALRQEGFHGVGWPRWEGLWGLLFSPGRGVLIWMPLALAGFWPLRRSSERSSVFTAGWAAAMSLLVVMAGFRDWHGGWFPGPRYLLPVMPILYVRLAVHWDAVSRSSRVVALWVAAVIWGVAMNWGSILSFPYPPESYPLPVLTFTRRLLAEGVGMTSWLASPLWWLLAFCGAVWAVVVLNSLATTGSRRPAALAGVLASLVALVVLSNLFRPPSSWKAKLEMAVVREVYCGVRPLTELPALHRECQSPAQCRQVARWIEQVNRSQQSRR